MFQSKEQRIDWIFLPNLAKYAFQKKSGDSLFICFNQSNIIKKIELVEIYFLLILLVLAWGKSILLIFFIYSRQFF
jgi:hypothetical protein